jgi:putative tryptophan/tyrosine transport system substrate-binding protein
MKRRDFITLLGSAVATWPLTARGQQTGKVYRVGFVAAASGQTPGPVMARGVPALLDELGKLGFSEGRNLIIDHRSSNQPTPQLLAELTELVRSKADVIVASGAEEQLQAVLAVNRDIPIVIWANNYDPIERGYVKSLAQPGGNVTGIFTRQPELAEKQVEILTQAFPEKTRLGVLWDAQTADQFDAAARRALALGRELHAVKLDGLPYDFNAAFRTLAEGSPQMLVVLSGPLFASYQPIIAELALQYRLPAMFILRTYVDLGGLMSYGVDIGASFRRIADFVAKILNGAKPADLPVEQPTKYRLSSISRRQRPSASSCPLLFFCAPTRLSSEPAQVHIAARWRGGRVAVCRACAAAGEGADHQFLGPDHAFRMDRRVCAARAWLDRESHRRDRVSLRGGTRRALPAVMP